MMENNEFWKIDGKAINAIFLVMKQLNLKRIRFDSWNFGEDWFGMMNHLCCNRFEEGN